MRQDRPPLMTELETKAGHTQETKKKKRKKRRKKKMVALHREKKVTLKKNSVPHRLGNGVSVSADRPLKTGVRS